jgi:origin recognition complex subunit 4
LSLVVYIRNSYINLSQNLGQKDDKFKLHLQTIFYHTKSIPAFLSSSFLPVSLLSSKNVALSGRTFLQNSFAPPESKLHLLNGLSDLEMALLISAARLDVVLDTDTCNFNMAYDEYTSLAAKHKLQASASGAAAVGGASRVWGREVAEGAWERLCDLELMVPATGGTGLAGGVTGHGGGVGMGGSRGGRMWRVDVGLEEIGVCEGLSAVMLKWCREI